MEPPFEPDVQLPADVENVLRQLEEEQGIRSKEDEWNDPNVIDYQEAPSEPTNEFDGPVGQDLVGLMYLGKLTQTVEILGHKFEIHTLKVGEELAIAQVVDEYAGTVMQGRAWMTAIVASCVDRVDGKPFLQPLGPDQVYTLREKFDYITKNWYFRVIEEVYTRYNELLGRQNDAYDDLSGK